MRVTHTHTHTHAHTCTVLFLLSGVVSIKEDNRNDGAWKGGFGEIRCAFIPHDIRAHSYVRIPNGHFQPAAVVVVVALVVLVGVVVVAMAVVVVVTACSANTCGQ